MTATCMHSYLDLEPRQPGTLGPALTACPEPAAVIYRIHDEQQAAEPGYRGEDYAACAEHREEDSVGLAAEPGVRVLEVHPADGSPALRAALDTLAAHELALQALRADPHPRNVGAVYATLREHLAAYDRLGPADRAAFHARTGTTP